MDTLAIYENELITSPFRQRTFSTIPNTPLCILLSLERKVFPVYLNISSVKEAAQFPLEIIPNPNTSLFLTVLLRFAKLYISLKGHLYNAHTRLCPFCVRLKSIFDYMEIPEVAMLRVSLPKTPGPAEV